MKNWVNESVFYHIYPLGFCGAPQFNKDEEKVVPRIKKVIEWIPHLKELGINAIYFGPLFESTEHGYDTADYAVIDKRLGANEDFKEVCEKLHENNIKVVVDGVFNHVGRDFWAFKDVIENRQNSKYCSWFQNLNFGGSSPMGDPFWYEGWEGHYNLVKLNLNNPELKKHLFSTIEMWMNEFKIDGIRFDVAYCMDENFFREVNAFCKPKKEDFWLMGEMVHGDYAKITKPGMLDSVTNYECYKGLYSSHNDKNYFEIAHSLNRQFARGGIYENIYTYNFVDNHDVNRVASVINNKKYLDNVYTTLFAMPGTPSIYYGSEWALEGTKSNGSDAGLRPCIELDKMDKDSELLKHISNLCRVRAKSEAMQYGKYEAVNIKNQQLVISRTSENEKIFILLNLADKPEVISFNTDGKSEFEELLTDKKVKITNGNVEVPAFSAMILK